MCANVTWDYALILRNIAESKRQMNMTTYQRAMERAADKRADRWLAYVPLTPIQLSDKDVDTEAADRITIATFGILGHTYSFSTSRSQARYRHYRVIHRPTEALAIRHALNNPVLDCDFEPIPALTIQPQRFCIVCKCSHPVKDFVRHHRYLHGLSYVCKAKIKFKRQGAWQLSA